MINGFRTHNKTKKQLGLSLLEALVATAIIGIGFIAIFQMTKYSVESINVSSDRTKANYLVEMVAEDLIANRHSKYGSSKFVDHLRKSGHVWKIDSCKKGPKKKAEVSSLYEDEKDNAPENKIRKWNALFSSDKHLKCRRSTASDTTTTTKDTKSLKIITICNSVECDYDSSGTEDPYSVLGYDKMYIGRMKVKMNAGKKIKFLYFQAHYVLEE